MEAKSRKVTEILGWLEQAKDHERERKGFVQMIEGSISTLNPAEFVELQDARQELGL